VLPSSFYDRNSPFLFAIYREICFTGRLVVFAAFCSLTMGPHSLFMPLFDQLCFRHKAARMYNPTSITAAFTAAEIPFIMLAASLFCVVFYFLLGFDIEAGRFFLFFLFVALGLGTFTFLGHMLALVFRDSASAQGERITFRKCDNIAS